MARAWATRSDAPVPETFGPVAPGGALGGLIARLLWQRGLASAIAAEPFLEPTLARGLRPPSAVPRLEEMAASIAAQGASLTADDAVGPVVAAVMLDGWIDVAGSVPIEIGRDGVRVGDVAIDGRPLGLGVTGVTFYLLIALRGLLKARGRTSRLDLRTQLDLAAVGTLADGSTLRDEQRVLVALGLRRMQEDARPGLAALAEMAHVARPTARAVASRIVPRLESSIRVGGPARVQALLRAATSNDAGSVAAAIELEAAQNRTSRTLDTTTSMRPIVVDAEWSLADVNARLMLALDRLEPFGAGNPEPVLVARAARLDGARLVGDPSRPWWRLRLRQDSHTVRAVAQHLRASDMTVGELYDVAYTPRPGHVRGGGAIEIAVHDLRQHTPLATPQATETTG